MPQSSKSTFPSTSLDVQSILFNLTAERVYIEAAPPKRLPEGLKFEDGRKPTQVFNN